MLPIPVLLDLVEAAVGCGHADRLVDIIAELGAVAERSKSPLLHAEWLAAQPLLSPKYDAERLFAVSGVLANVIDNLPAILILAPAAASTSHTPARRTGC